MLTYTLPIINCRAEMYWRTDRHRRVMKANLKDLAKPRHRPGEARVPVKRPTKKTPERLPPAERQARVLDKAAEYFAEHGLNAQTRAVADARGWSPRVLS